MTREKELQVIQAAYRVFLRYGLARTTMADLAKEAGLSRPALYLVYPGKAEVFAAVLGWMTDSMVEAVTAGLKPGWSLEQKLTHALEIYVAQGYDQVKANPDAQDLLALDGQVPGLDEAYAKLQACLAGIVEPAVAASGWKTTAGEIARLLMSSVRGFKSAAADGEDFRRLIALQVAMVGAALARKPPAA